MVKQQIRLIDNGQEDQRILKENLKNKTKISKAWGILWNGCSLLLLLFLTLTLVFSIISGNPAGKKIKGVPSVRVVSSTSMSFKNERNEYLIENNLNDQMQIFDLVILHELPTEEDIELYDVIVYESREGVLVIHRVVGIEEPNEKHPDERWFQFKGDASDGYDRFPVTYEQMRSIYHGQRIPHVGSFVFFMQSPAGILCFLLVVFAVISTPIVEKKLERAKSKRLETLNSVKVEDVTDGVIVKAYLITDEQEIREFKDRCQIKAGEKQDESKKN